MKKFTKSILTLSLAAMLAVTGPFFSIVHADDTPATTPTTEVVTPTSPSVPTTPITPATPVVKKAVKINQIKCLSNGQIRILFQRNVEYLEEALKVSVTSEKGEAVTVKILKKDKNFMYLDTGSLTNGVKYTFNVYGVRVKGEKAYGSASKVFVENAIKTSVKACKQSKKIKCKATVTLKIKCTKKVALKDATVTVKDKTGKEYAAKIVRAKNKEIRVNVTGLKKKTTYTITITGVKTGKEVDYGTISTTFKTK